MILTPAVREHLIAVAKSRAEPVANCVGASVSFAHLVQDLPREGLYALVAVLAEGSDRQRLHRVVTAPAEVPVQEAPPLPPPVVLRLRRLHAEYKRYRVAGTAVEAIPDGVRAGEMAYQRDAKRRQRRTVA